MQLMKPYFTTLSFSKRSNKSAIQLKREAEHEVWMRKNGVHPDQLKMRKSNSRNKVCQLFTDPVSKLTTPDLSGIGPTGFKKQENVYTGKNLVGIAVMHKSCLQHILN